MTKDFWLLVGAAICGGAPDVPQFEIMKRLPEQQTDPTEALTVKTTFLGTRENPSDTGAISGISMANFHPAALIRGTLNGMATELYEFYRVLDEQAGISRHKLVAAGNGIRRSEALQRILSDLFGLPLTVEQNEEEAALGAAISSLAMSSSFLLNNGWMGGIVKENA